MPYKNPKDRPIYKDSPLEHKKRMERQRARRAVDKKYPDKNGNGQADIREGKDVSHKKALDKGGSNKDGYFVQDAKKNRSFKRDSKHNLVSEASKRERKKVIKK
jgi:hypothetical protein